jgi:DNA-binding NarL/FixJ family response regulator
VVDGFTNLEIAVQLGLSIDTIKTHVDHICEKLQVARSSRSRVLAIARAIQFGLVPGSSS